MATLTTAEKATITALITRLEKGGVEIPSPNEDFVAVLTPLQTKFGLTGVGKPGLAIALQNRPFSTLLKALLAVAA